MRFKINPASDKFYRIDLPLNNFESYINEMEKSLLDMYFSNLKEHGLENEELDDEFEDEDEEDGFVKMFEYLTSPSHLYLFQFPSILRTSLFLSIYSFLETQLILLCKQLQAKKRIDISVTDLKGNGIEMASKYLKKVIGISFPDTSKEWVNVKHYNHLRNCIAHNGGIVNRDKKELIKAIDAIPYIRIEDNGYDESLRFEPLFCTEFINNIKAFWELLEKEYRYVLHPWAEFIDNDDGIIVDVDLK